MAPTEQEWNEWLAQYASRFLLFARQQTRCCHDAEDVLQASLIESWKRSGAPPDPALVFATIRRRAIDLGRSNDRRRVREESNGSVLMFVSTPRDRETAECLERAISLLPKEQRDVLTLKFWGDLTFAEVAETLEIPQGTAASRYRLALDALRQSLTPALT